MTISRAAEWKRISDRQLAVSPAVAMDIFRVMFDAIEKDPRVKLTELAPQILTQLTGN